MARRKQSTNLEPAEMTLTFPIGQIDGSNTMKTIDLSQCASIVNRRFYRQGLNWAVAGFTLHAVSGSGSVGITRLPQTWVTAQSWEKAMRLWLRQQRRGWHHVGCGGCHARRRCSKHRR